MLILKIYETLTRGEDCDDLSIGFHHDQQRLLKFPEGRGNVTGKCQVGIFSKYVLGFAEHQKNAKNELG